MSTDTSNRRRALASAAGLFIAFALLARAAVPTDALLGRLQPQGKVNDFAGLLSAEEREGLEQVLNDLEQKTGAQVAVVTLKSLEGGQIEDFTEKLFQRWGVGQKGKDNGVMFLVAIEDRAVRIEVGYGLEPTLPDIVCGRILSEEVAPAFREGRYAEGIRRATRRIAAILGGDESAAEPTGASGDDEGAMAAITAFLALFVGIGLFSAGAGAGSRSAFPIIWGGFFGGIPLLMAAAMAASGEWLPLCILVPFGLLVLRCGFSKGRAHPGKYRPTRSYGSRSTGWSWGATSGHSGGGGFSSSGGGGFGGGSSGGGGASGSW